MEKALENAPISPDVDSCWRKLLETQEKEKQKNDKKTEMPQGEGCKKAEKLEVGTVRRTDVSPSSARIKAAASSSYFWSASICVITALPLLT